MLSFVIIANACSQYGDAMKDPVILACRLCNVLIRISHIAMKRVARKEKGFSSSVQLESNHK